MLLSLLFGLVLWFRPTFHTFQVLRYDVEKMKGLSLRISVY